MPQLINGLIPAGTACPFLNNCKFKVHTCPGSDNGVKAKGFSCAAARMHDMMKPSAAPEPVIHHDVVLSDDEGYTD